MGGPGGTAPNTRILIYKSFPVHFYSYIHSHIVKHHIPPKICAVFSNMEHTVKSGSNAGHLISVFGSDQIITAVYCL